MTRYVRQISDPLKQTAAEIAEGWGYPRTISTEEIAASEWISWGEPREIAALAWFFEGPEPGSVQVHACARPDARCLIGTPRNMVTLEIVAELHGAKRLYSVLPRGELGEGLPVEAMRRLLVSRGWSEDFYGAYRELGVNHGD